MLTILDCYTDEPAGLGVPPFIGTYPRYIFGMYSDQNPTYITIDDVRSLKKIKKKDAIKTDISIYNTTRPPQEIQSILKNTTTLIVIAGVHVPGKYLSARPASVREVRELINNIGGKKILAGPAATEFGSQVEGGKSGSQIQGFDERLDLNLPYEKLSKYANLGAPVVKQTKTIKIAEIETGRGCRKKIPCSFCTEPLKCGFESREQSDIVDEIKSLNKCGIIHFRLGKQSDLFSYPNLEELLHNISKINGIKTLHIDNIDPSQVIEEKVKLIVKYCSPGNVAALGIETFDPNIIKLNNLNSTPEMSFKAIKVINKQGKIRSNNGMPHFLPGVNIIMGLIGETKNTHIQNMKYLTRILDENLYLRRINIRKVALYPGTKIFDQKKQIRKNSKYYWKWRNEVRQKVDYPMLQKLVPIGTILRDCYAEIHDGNTTFLRQIGTYPLIVGVKKRLRLGSIKNIKITGHMLRSVMGELVQ